MTLKTGAKFEEKLTCSFKNYKTNLLNFRQDIWKSENFQLKKVQRSYVSWHWRVMQNLKKIWLVVWKMTWEDLANFHLSTCKSQNFHFDGLLLSEVFNVQAKKLQRNYVSWHRKVMENLRNWLLVSKMTRGIWWIFTKALDSPKIWNLICSFCRFVQSLH